MAESFNDIYEYFFNSLFIKVKGEIGRVSISLPEETAGIEDVDESVESELLFDIGGDSFRTLKSREADYRFWVEVYTLKILEALLLRIGRSYEERYYPSPNEEPSTEQYSIKFSYDGKTVEAYVLFDIFYGEYGWTDYYSLAKKLKERSNDVDEVNIFILRDCITWGSLAWLINTSPEYNENGFLTVFPIKDFFSFTVGEDKYSEYKQFVDAFFNRCQAVISYKTVAVPTADTVKMFKRKKAEMLRGFKYETIADSGKLGILKPAEYERVYKQFTEQKMYLAMVSPDNDFADSFISAEWAFDIFSNAMGELELTGIIAGYLKSVEQLMYRVVQFHKGEGLMIDPKDYNEEKIPYDNDTDERRINSTLWSLNRFLTSFEGKLALSSGIRMCIKNAVKQWTSDERNGYFHKHNLYKADNKISEIRDQTIYLYFLILGGIAYKDEEKMELGIQEHTESSTDGFSYFRFKKWLDGMLKYDVPEETQGIYLTVTYWSPRWIITPYIMTHFCPDEFELGGYNVINPDFLRIGKHTMDLPEYMFEAPTKLIEGRLPVAEEYEYLRQLDDHLTRYQKEEPDLITKTMAIVASLGNNTRLLYYRYSDDYFGDCFGVADEDEQEEE